MAMQTDAALRRSVIYEVYVRSHTPEGTFRAIEPDLDRIAALGVDIVWFMPIHPIGEQNKKGSLGCPYANRDYRTVNPEYGTLEDFLHLVEEIHKRGMKCIIDVVYNHTSPDSTLVTEHPEYFYRKPDGTRGNKVGDWTDVVGLDYENRALWQYQIDSLCYWAEEYHLDGFRFDLAGIIDAETIRLAQQELERKNPGLLLYGEGWDMHTVVTKQDVSLATQKQAPALPGFGFFNDTIRDLVRGPLFETADPGFASGAFPALSELAAAFAGRPGWTEDPKQSINYCSCHDNYTLADRIALAKPHISKQELARRNRLAAAFCILSQGVPFFQAGEEMLRSKPSGRGGFVDNSYRSSDRVNALRWNSFESPEALQTLRYYQGLIAVRKEFPLFRLTSRGQIDEKLHFFPCGGSHTPGFLLEDAGRRLLVIFHPEDTPLEVSLPRGTWNALVWDNDAGTRILFQAEGRILLPPVAAAVLTADNTTRMKLI